MNSKGGGTVFAAISPMIAWAVYFAAVYALQGLGCTAQWDAVSLAGSNVLTLMLALLSLLALGVIALLGGRGLQTRRAGVSGPASGHDVAQRARFLGLVRVVLAAVAFVATLMNAAPLLFLAPCR